MSEWLQLCRSRSVVRRALASALIVGTILITINHGDAILRGQIDQDRVLKMILTVCVPYLVSTFSSVSTIRQMRKQSSEESH
ncbi:MAG: nitrate/nitrite transporter NrtS [Chloroflexi bacterium]|nr:nitrate/nitrite transporter NrtS [Chloroflexota bacterium]